MKTLVVTLLALATISAHAQDFSQKNLRSALKVATCEMKIVNLPVVFGKDQAHARSQKMIFKAHESSSDLRRLKKNRILKIHSITHKDILLDDQALNSVCVLDGEKSRCTKDINKLTISQIEELSGGNVKINCLLDPVKDI